MSVEEVPEWEALFVDEVIRTAEDRLRSEHARARSRALQLAREQAYHRLAVALDRRAAAGPGQLRLFRDESALFDDPA